MSDSEIQLEDMKEAVERLFEREYPNPNGIVHYPGSDVADLVYIERVEDGLHALRFEHNYNDCIFDLDSGIHAAQELPANLRWVVLPLDDFRDGEDEYNDVMTQQCKSRGVGIITVQPRGRGFSAKVILEAEVESGDFVEHWPDVAEKWEEVVAQDPQAADGWRVVPY